MNITQTKADGLKREFKIVIPGQEIENAVLKRLSDLGKTAKISGFRPGRVPLPILKQRYGQSLRSEAVEEVVKTTADKVLEDQKIRPALRPKITLESAEEGQDATFKMDVEILPELPPVSLKNIKLQRLVTDVTTEAVEEEVRGFLERNTRWEKVEEKRPAQKGDILIIDFEGKSSGRSVTGGLQEGFAIKLGEEAVLPSFEENLLGKQVGDRVQFTVTYAKDDSFKRRAGKEVVFDILLKEVRIEIVSELNDAFAQEKGMKDLADLRGRIQKELQEKHHHSGFLVAKREILDQLDGAHQIEIPQSLVDIEFETIWRQFEQAQRREQEKHEERKSPGEDQERDSENPQGSSDADSDAASPLEPWVAQEFLLKGERISQKEKSGTKGKKTQAQARSSKKESLKGESPEDLAKTKEEYRKIAERRVKLGLLLSEIGRAHQVSVTKKEIDRALVEIALKYPGHEREVIKFYRENSTALETVRGPLFEDKVIGVILEKAQVTDQKVSNQELEKRVHEILDEDEVSDIDADIDTGDAGIDAKS